MLFRKAIATAALAVTFVVSSSAVVLAEEPTNPESTSEDDVQILGSCRTNNRPSTWNCYWGRGNSSQYGDFISVHMSAKSGSGWVEARAYNGCPDGVQCGYTRINGFSGYDHYSNDFGTSAELSWDSGSGYRGSTTKYTGEHSHYWDYRLVGELVRLKVCTSRLSNAACGSVSVGFAYRP